MFYIRKKGSNNFWHVYNNGTKNVSISDFEVVLDDVANTFAIILRNGANIPQTILNVTDIIVVDETDASVEETFTNVTDLRNRLVVLGYTAYLGAGNADSITGLVEAGTNVTITGSGTLADPYVISSSGGSGSIPTLQQVTDEGNYSPNSIQIDYGNGASLQFVDGEDNILSEINASGNFFRFIDTAGSGNEFQTDGTELSDGNKILATREWVTNEIPTNATDLDALKRNGSNANSDVDLATNGYGLVTKTLKVGSPATQMEVRTDDLTTNRQARFQDKDYSGIADITDIPTTLASLTDDSTHRLVTDTEKSTWNAKQNALGYTAENTANKSSSYTASSTTTYANTKALVDGLATKQDALGFTPDTPSSIMCLNADYTGTSSTSLQKAFNVGSSGNGSFPALANKKYRMMMLIYVDSMSATSGTLSFGLLGTATIDFIFGSAIAKKTGTASSPASGQMTLINSTTQAVVTATTTTTGYFLIEAEFTTTSSGTIIPAFAVSQSATPIVKKGSCFVIREIGANTFTATSDIV